MRFTSVGPKWRAALRSSLSRRVCLSLFLRAACSLSLPALSDAATIPLPPAVLNPSSLSPPPLSLSLGAPRCGADCRNAPNAPRADRCPSPFHRFHLFTSAVCLSSSLSPSSSARALSLSLSLSRSLALSLSLALSFSCSPHPFAVIRFFFLQSGYSASADHSRILYIVLPPPPLLPLPGMARFSLPPCDGALFSPPRPRSTIVRTHAHAYAYAGARTSRTQEHVVSSSSSSSLLPRMRTSSRTSRRPFSRPPAALSLSLFPPRRGLVRLAFFAAVSFDRTSFYAPVPG